MDKNKAGPSGTTHDKKLLTGSTHDLNSILASKVEDDMLSWNGNPSGTFTMKSTLISNSFGNVIAAFVKYMELFRQTCQLKREAYYKGFNCVMLCS
ncbi:hypothetical protein ACH5RR_003304 [Cinchona calisaya]|uniref:Uncharacterized protein n=1 Tax=Cinchona calisaya TaxID=153742 RepID=A0ABD3AUT8_9GENT